MKAAGSVIKGWAVLLVLFGSVGLFAVGMRAGLWRVARDRFAVSIRTAPESERKLLSDRPLLVRIEKSRAGRSPHRAVALVLAGDGSILHGPAPLLPAKDERGRTIEEARFAPLGRVPAGGMVAGLVLRVPDPAAVLPEVERRIREAAARGSELRLITEQVGRLCQEAGGRAEVATAEVRAP
jgi:hypothetical protein